MAKDDKKKKPESDVVDLISRIGARGSPAPQADAPSEITQLPPSPPSEDGKPARHDAPVEGPPKPRLVAEKPDRDQSALIRTALNEERDNEAAPAIPSPRTAPGPGEIDLIATPLPTPDDWHRFELALRRVPGVGPLRTEYYRHGVLKVRVSFQRPDRFASVLRAGVPGYRVRVIGEDRATLQILVSAETEERRPG